MLPSLSGLRKIRPTVVVLLIAIAVYLPGMLSPPSLMDDVDAVQAQIARNMLSSGDWVTARIDGVAYFEKSPLVYWLIALSFKAFGVHDWAARLPIAASSIGLALLTTAFAQWAFGKSAGLNAGLVMATCTGLWLFTRILIPDVMLAFTITLAMWSFLRALDEREKHPQLWASVLAACLGLGLLLKSLIAVVFPLGAGIVFLAITGELFSRKAWSKLHPIRGIAILLAIAAPWHVLAAIRNPPGFAWTFQSGPGSYHGFLWFYFVNEQLLRFLNLRYPRDYNTVPRVYFWLFHLIWLFPWSAYIPAIARLSFRPAHRPGRTRLLGLIWIGTVLVFFTFSTTQEYYSMPCYPAFALLLGSAMTKAYKPIRWGTRALSFLLAAMVAVVIAILFAVRSIPAPGDISSALSSHPQAYSLSLGHMEDLTLASFAYLRAPLTIAGIAFLAGLAGTFARRQRHAYLSLAVMMTIFFQGARLALIQFDPLLSSRAIAERILHGSPGRIVVDYHYYTFSSIAFYTGQTELLLNGRWNNLEYGANQPGSPDVFIDDSVLRTLWSRPGRIYLVAKADQLSRFAQLLGPTHLRLLERSGEKVLLCNRSPQ